MQVKLWNRLIGALPQDMTVERVAHIFNRSPGLTRRRLQAAGYRFKEHKPRVWLPPDWADHADWKLPNSEIGRKFGICRERVRQMRNRLKLPKVENRGRKSATNGKHVYASKK